MVTKTDFSSIEVMARLTDTKIEAREICEKWLLLTYDLPNTEEGNKARAAFLAQARLYGATKHTDSVYLMPWTKKAEMLALDLAKKGEVCVWTSQTTDKTEAERVTRRYDEGLEPVLDKISDRLDKIAGHLFNEHYKTAYRMLDKTGTMLEHIEQAIIRRGSAQLYLLVTVLQRRFASLYGKGGGGL